MLKHCDFNVKELMTNSVDFRKVFGLGLETFKREIQ